MTPKGKCDELVLKFNEMMNETLDVSYMYSSIENVDLAAKRSALIAVDEMLIEIEMMKLLKELKSIKRYLSFWQQVKDEINNL